MSGAANAPRRGAGAAVHADKPLRSGEASALAGGRSQSAQAAAAHNASVQGGELAARLGAPTRASAFTENAKTIMLQGTASGVGKSTLAIGLCRVLAQSGVRVAPFKAQNLSDNAHFLPDGRRMARSQAIAAAACGLAPQTDMNPVLLVPRHGGCEIVLHGESIGDTRDYADQNALFARLKQEALAAHARLAQQYDVLVAEGAGSPVELNLRARDFVNMGFARAVQCPVLLVSDIRRGGVFAMVHGTLALLHPAERALVKGIVVNGFCGDPADFAGGAQQLAAVARCPVLGVVPQLSLQLEDEDSLPGRDTRTRESIARALPAGISYAQQQAAQFDLLANALRTALDLEAVRRLLL